MVASWDVADDALPLDLRDLMRLERAELVSFLSSLSPKEWHARAVGSWNVHAVTLHLFRNDFGRLQETPSVTEEMDNSALADEIERGNDEWVEVSQVIPPSLMADLLFLSGKRMDEHLAQMDMQAPGTPVAWTGTGPSPNWLDIAREYTERWVHHQQIRDAVGKEGVKDREWMHPVFETFMLALPRAYEPVQAPDGTEVRVVVEGPSGGSWYIRRDVTRWRLVARSIQSWAEVHLPQEIAWRLYTRLVAPNEAISSIQRRGPAELTEPACRAVAMMTSSA